MTKPTTHRQTTMNNMPQSQLLLLLLLLLLTMASASWRDWYDEEAVEVPTYRWNRPSRSKLRCVSTNKRCDSTTPCCRLADVCMTGSQTESDGLRSARCVTWLDSMAFAPRLANGASCTDSWQCANKCCREYRAHRHAPILECGTPFDGLEWHTCITA
ncbi:hypothetical protein BsWGS_09270 [Bradybaena similaris]